MWLRATCIFAASAASLCVQSRAEESDCSSGSCLPSDTEACLPSDTERHRVSLLQHTASISLASVSKKCEDHHPAVLEEATHMNAWDIMECYAVWHNARLAAWAQEGDTSCTGRDGLLLYVDRGFGDSGHHIVSRFIDALREGRMFLMKPQAAGRDIWELAVDRRFDWDAGKHAGLLCKPEWQNSEPIDPVFQRVGAGVSQSALTRALTWTIDFGPALTAEAWKFLNRPIPEVETRVNQVMRQVASNEKLVAVHFRAQWVGEHFACGCKDVAEIGKCASSIPAFLKQRGVPGFTNESQPVKLFVASDLPAGINAFTQAFGEENILSLPDVLPIEHSLQSSKQGAIRTLADFLLLTKADVLLGSCGSTFTSAAIDFVSRDRSTAVISGSNDAAQCAGNAKDLDYSGFQFSSFSSKDMAAADVCGCYSPSDKRGGTCHVACNAEQKQNQEGVPSQCTAQSCPMSTIDISQPTFRSTPSSSTSLLAWGKQSNLAAGPRRRTRDR